MKFKRWYGSELNCKTLSSKNQDPYHLLNFMDRSGSGTKLENIVLKEPGSVPPFELY